MGFIGAIVAVATIGGFLFGYDSGAVNGTQDGLRTTFGLSDWWLGFTVGSLLIGCFIGAFLAGRLADLFGRRNVMMMAAVLFLIGALLQGFAESHLLFLFARIAGGMAVGAASVLSPAYISEVAPASIRGRMTTVQQIMIITGLTAAFVVNYFLAARAGDSTAAFWAGIEAWRWMYLMQALPAAVFLVALLLIPESPRYLVSKGRDEKALSVLTSLYGADVARAKLEEIRATFSADHRPRLSDVIDRSQNGLFGIRPIVWAGILLAVFQQLVGINVIFYYGATLWQLAGFTEDQSLQINIVSGAVSIAACFITIALVDKIGRKPLLLIGSAGMAVTLFALVYAFANGTLDAEGNLSLRDLLQRQLGPDHVGDARRDVPEPDPRFGARRRRLRAVVLQLSGRADLPGHGGMEPGGQLHLLRGFRGDQLLPRAEVHSGDKGEGTGRNAGLISPYTSRGADFGPRPFSFRSDADCDFRAGDAWHAHLEGEQSARERLSCQIGIAQALARRRRKSCAKIRAAKRDLGDVGSREPHLGDYRTIRRIAPGTPTAPQSGPKTSLAVDRRSVGIAVCLIDSSETAAIGEAAVGSDIVAVDRAGERVGVIENPPVEAERRAVGDAAFAADAIGPRPLVQRVDRAAIARLIVVHRSEPKPAVGPNGGIIQPIPRKLGLRRDQMIEAATGGIEPMQTRLEPGDESAACGRQYEARLRGRIPAPSVPGRRIEAMDLALLDIGEPERRLACDPDRPFSKRRFEGPDADRLPHISASLHPRRNYGW
jgi:MFS transporter, SP family, sugar:H+ symporter